MRPKMSFPIQEEAYNTGSTSLVCSFTGRQTASPNHASRACRHILTLEYETKYDRERTYFRITCPWPSHLLYMVPSLVEAGFYYQGYGDVVQCFCCGGWLRNCKHLINPLYEHLRFYPHCEYLRNLLREWQLQKLREHMNMAQHKTDGPEGRMLQRINSSEVVGHLSQWNDLGVQWVDTEEIENVNDLASSDHWNFSDSDEDEEEPLQGAVGSQENQRNFQIDERYICRGCSRRERDVILYPCGHSVCVECARCGDCPECNMLVRLRVRGYHNGP